MSASGKLNLILLFTGTNIISPSIRIQLPTVVNDTKEKRFAIYIERSYINKNNTWK